MFNKYIGIFLISITMILSIIGFDLKKDRLETNSYSTSEPLKEIENKPEINITAEFKITTYGTVRVFTDKRYHNLSETIYLDSNNPNLVHIKKDSVTWYDFFETLPMSLDKNCLVTGTKQTFCTNGKNFLTFKINNKLDPDALEKEVKQDDYLFVEYK